ISPTHVTKQCQARGLAVSLRTPPRKSAPPSIATPPPQKDWVQEKSRMVCQEKARSLCIAGWTAVISPPIKAQRLVSQAWSIQQTAALAQANGIHTPHQGSPNRKRPAASARPCPGGYFPM